MRTRFCRRLAASITLTVLVAGLVVTTAPVALAGPATKLVFTTSSQVLSAGNLSGTITVQQRDSADTPVHASSPRVVSLSTTSSGGVFRNTADTATITSVTIPNGSSSVSFRYRDTVAGSPTLTASSTGLTSGTQTETINPGPFDHVVISPDPATIAAGDSQAYSASAFDAFNNFISNVTTSTIFTIAPNGSCTGNTCTASIVGAHTVTGKAGTKTDTATLNVNPSTLARIVISPSTRAVKAGVSQAYTAAGFDRYGNALGDVTATTTFSIAPNGSCVGAACSATTTGAHTVTGNNNGFTDDATLNVKPAALASIVISPDDATIGAGGSQAYTSEAFDVYGNSRGDLTSTTVFSITPNGSCTGNVCTASLVGDHTVKGVKGKSDTATLHVVSSGTVASIVVSPSAATVAAGIDQTYTARSFDAFGNPLGDVTSSTTFSIGPDGSCVGNECSATVAGNHTVTGSFETFSDDALLTVNAGPIHHIVLSPADATIVAGDSQTYTAEAFDQYGNSKGDVTSTTTFSITPNGSCALNVCTASLVGDHTVRGLTGGVEAFATLHVVSSGTVDSIAISPSTATVAAGVSQTYTAQTFDRFGNPIDDVTSSTTFTIAPDGSCTSNTCTATVAGPHTVTGTFGSFTDDAMLTVNPAGVDRIELSPPDVIVPVGGSQSYAVEGFDAFGNTKGDFTSRSTFSIAPDGSCTNNVCGSSVAGDHTVKAQWGAASDTAILRVGGSTPALTGFAPTTGWVGTIVTLTGTAFTGATDVQFNGTSAAFTIESDTQITAAVPDGALTGKVTVVAPGGTVSSSGNFRVQPKLTSFTPASGPVGTVVTISGFAFTGATAVTFDGLAATGFSVDSYHQITATVPCCGVAGRIIVTTPGGMGGSLTSFKVPPEITSFNPSVGPVGTVVTISGTGFTGTTSVQFRGIAATFTVDSENQITATVPVGATTGKIKVVTGGGAVSSATVFTVI